jgi:hypothetical protein
LDLEEAATNTTTRTARRRIQHHLQNLVVALSTESNPDLRLPATMMRIAARRAARMTVDVLLMKKKKMEKLDRPAPLVRPRPSRPHWSRWAWNRLSQKIAGTGNSTSLN